MWYFCEKTRKSENPSKKRRFFDDYPGDRVVLQLLTYRAEYRYSGQPVKFGETRKITPFLGAKTALNVVLPRTSRNSSKNHRKSWGPLENHQDLAGLIRIGDDSDWSYWGEEPKASIFFTRLPQKRTREEKPSLLENVFFHGVRSLFGVGFEPFFIGWKTTRISLVWLGSAMIVTETIGEKNPKHRFFSPDWLRNARGKRNRASSQNRFFTIIEDFGGFSAILRVRKSLVSF